MRARMARRLSLCFFFETAWEARIFFSSFFFSWHVVFFPMTTKQPCFETRRQPANIAFCRNRYSKHLFFSAYLTLPTGIILLDLDKRPTWVKCSKKRGDHDLLAMIFQATKKNTACVYLYQGVFCSKAISIDCDMTSGERCKTSGRSDRWRLDW